MKATKKKKQRQSRAAANRVAKQKSKEQEAVGFGDNRPRLAASRLKLVPHGPSGSAKFISLYTPSQDFQKKENKTRLADSQKAGNQSPAGVVQRVVYPTMPLMWAAVAPGTPVATITGIINQSPELQQVYADVTATLGNMNFIQNAGTQPTAAQQPAGGLYDITYGLHGTLAPPYNNLQRYISVMLHEMMHVTTAIQYNQNAAAGGVAGIANMNLPAAVGAVLNPAMGLDAGQQASLTTQLATMNQNWDNLRTEVINERENGTLTIAQRDVLIGANNIGGRIGYAQGVLLLSHYDTVLTDILYYLIDQGLAGTRTYRYAARMLAEANARRQAAAGVVANVAPEARGWCYITTACVQYKGLADDCEELTVLRDFRDNYLLKRKNGKQLIKLYYDYSPLILNSIKQRNDEDEVLARLYKIIKKCVDAIKDGDNEFAYNMYCKMVLKLKEECIPKNSNR